jgi:FkbM family methyltransferase
MYRARPNDLTAFGRYAPSRAMSRLLRFTRKRSPGWLGKRLAFMMRSAAIRRLKGRPLDVEVFGAKMRLYPYDNVCERRILFTPQYFDLSERQFLSERITDDFVFIDIGANIGGYTLFVAARSCRGRILAIEPQPDVFERLVFNIRQNTFANTKALDCAVADQDGEVTLFVDTGNRGETSMRFIRPEGGSHHLRVAGRSLQNIVTDEGFTHIDAIKIDTEGGSDLILEAYLKAAALNLLPKWLLIEYSAANWPQNLERVLLEKGYSRVLQSRANVVYELGSLSSNSYHQNFGAGLPT